MALVKVELPPGYSRQGTLYQTPGRWYDGNFVRWYQGSMQPIGGWTARYASTLTGKPRALHAWRSNDLTRFLACGTHSKLYAATVSLTAMVDITPVGFTAGRADATATAGYGTGLYGAGLYGTPRTDSVSIQDASVWTLDNFGQYLVGCMSDDGKAYEWRLDTGTPTVAATISGAPTGNAALIVTPENFLMLLGAGGNPRKVQWSDQGDNTTWTPTATNQAGDYTIQSNGRLMCARKVRGQTLIFTDADLHLASYIGFPYIYSITRVGENCGVISRQGAAAVDARCFWMGLSGFYMWDGSSVIPLSCDVYDAVFGDLNATQRSKVTAGVNSKFSEVWWAFPSADSTENDTVVTYNYLENHWELHAFTAGRTAIIDRGVFSNPIMADSNGYLYDHESGTTWDSTPYAESGPQEIGVGDSIARVKRAIFDEDTQGDVEISFKVRDWPNLTETTYGPYASGNPVSVRFAGRQVRQRVEFQGAGKWGAPRFEVIPGGKRGG